MKFKCVVCKENLSKSYDDVPENADILARPWYIDETGLKHTAIVCLKCGTIHDCSGSIMRSLLSPFSKNLPMKVHRDISPLRLGIAIMDATKETGQDCRTIAIHEFGIPEEVIDILVIRNLLGPAFADAILAKYKEIASFHEISFNEQEWNLIKYYRDIVATSSLRGLFVHPIVFKSLCYHGIQESLLRNGLELLKDNKIDDAISSLEKAVKFISWPTVLYALGIAYKKEGLIEKSHSYFSKVVEVFDRRHDILKD